jgi:hypothetical protein
MLTWEAMPLRACDASARRQVSISIEALTLPRTLVRCTMGTAPTKYCTYNSRKISMRSHGALHVFCVKVRFTFTVLPCRFMCYRYASLLSAFETAPGFVPLPDPPDILLLKRHSEPLTTRFTGLDRCGGLGFLLHWSGSDVDKTSPLPRNMIMRQNQTT